MKPEGRSESISRVDTDGSDTGPETIGPQAPARKKRAAGRHELLIGMVILSAAFVIGSLSVASALRSRNQPPSTHEVTVTGSAQRAVTADTFELDATVASTKPTTSAALAQLNRWTKQIRATLDGAGAHDNEIRFGSVVVQPNTDDSGAVATFSESQSVTVRSSRLPAIERVSGVTNVLLAHNVPFIAEGPQYTFSGLHRLRPVLTAEATADARVRAQAALGSHGHLGRMISISVGQFSVDAPGSVNIGSGDYYTGSTHLVVSVAVSATYSISS